MERLPLIDVAEPERIAALTEAPDTVSFRADAAENLDGLVPDIGLTGKYPYRSVYRPRSFASAGLAATLTHRFWDTIDGTSDHTGRRWIGVVMYDEHGFDCRLEVTLGADPIGCMVPFRHDNRRHLYVLDRPVQFMGEMEVLRISGTGDAGYRLERVVLLEERPAATCYQPRIERLTARLRRRPDGSFAVAVDGITWPATRCSVAVTRGDTGVTIATAREADCLSLHAISVAPLPAPAPAGYRARIGATEADGRHETAEVAVAGERGDAVPPAAGGTAAAIPALLTVRGAALAIQRDGNHVAQWPSGPPEGTVIPEGGAVRLIHDHDQGHRVETAGAVAEVAEVARRIRGHVTVSSAAAPGHAAAEPPLTVALRRFWQTCPRAVRVTGDEIAVELLPVPSGAARPGDEESWHRIYFWLGDDGYASSCAAATRAGSSSAARRRDT